MQCRIEIFRVMVRYDPAMMMDLMMENTYKNSVAFSLTRKIVTQFSFPLNIESPPLRSLLYIPIPLAGPSFLPHIPSSED